MTCRPAIPMSKGHWVSPVREPPVIYTFCRTLSLFTPHPNCIGHVRRLRPFCAIGTRRCLQAREKCLSDKKLQPGPSNFYITRTAYYMRLNVRALPLRRSVCSQVMYGRFNMQQTYYSIIFVIPKRLSVNIRQQTKHSSNNIFKS